ncbi:hypothetical protein FEM48_Zijuj06G0119800 [Ziziphus jujuba var. spinosa]|uniref:FAF domain-containing protein n=1 Tax=Ziziphus jujuba var. spinosa TaxID=714518 RepID=A0A978V959_ZIZJJ|nr:hypothetical protein FEM48_Zijuj06G0119800 [Ziziphus jujuba var. spinosa]
MQTSDASLHVNRLCLEDLTLCSDIQQPPERQPSCSGGDCRSIMTDFLSTSPCLSSSFNIGDYIGAESCVDVLKDDDQDQRPLDINDHHHDDLIRNRQPLSCKRDQRQSLKKREFPPPIPLLARTENLHCHMPWVLKRHYTSDGRLILTEEKVKHHEYFRAHRSNGRLTLQLVPLDDDDDDAVLAVDNLQMDDEDDDEETDEIKIETDPSDVNKDDDDYDDDDDKDYDFMEVEKEVEVDNKEHDILEAKKGNDGKYCMKYNSVRSASTCIFGVPVPVPAIRPVHT